MTDPKPKPSFHPGDTTEHAPRPPAGVVADFDDSFLETLAKAGGCLMVTTIEANQLLVVGIHDGRLEIRSRAFNHPMGLAVDEQRLAVGSFVTVERLCNIPELAEKLFPGQNVGAVFAPRNVHLTGNIDIHEMSWCGDKLWFVNTRFSSLCTLDTQHSFVPQWRPPFVTALVPEDRCHLNGLAVVDGQPRYASALGVTNQKEGWRENKTGGGIVMDVELGETIASGLNMPHSPRWHQGKLWLLESGTGRFGHLELSTGQLVEVANLPGYVRGLAFMEHFAFVGISQPRESSEQSDRKNSGFKKNASSGIWVIDLFTGKVAGRMRFSTAIRELFTIGALPDVRRVEVLMGSENILEVAWTVPESALR